MNLTDACDFKNLPLPLMDGATNSEDEIVAASRPSKSHLAHQSDMQVTEVDPELTRKIRELGQLVRVLSPQATGSHRVRIISSELRCSVT